MEHTGRGKRWVGSSAPWWALALVVSALAVGCEGRSDSSEESATASSASAADGAKTGDEEAGGAAKSSGAEDGAAAKIGPDSRLVTLGGAITEIVFALGHGDRVVGVDASSTYPEEATEREQVGYYRKLSAEGVLSLRPTHILMNAAAGPPAAIEQLEAAGADLVTVEDADDVDGALERVERLGALLGASERATAIRKEMRGDLDRVARRREAIDEEPGCALFIYARGPNVLMVSGTGTSAHEMLELAGVSNCIESFEDFAPLTPEAVVTASPAFIVVPKEGARSIGGAAGISKLPGVAQTPAGARESYVMVDDLALLGFGPRMGDALLELQDGLGVPELPVGGEGGGTR